MRLIEGILISCIVLTILYIAYLYFQRTNSSRWNDLPPESFEDVPTTPKQPISSLATNQDYKAFFEWQTAFCQTWNKVVEQSLSVDNFKGSPVDYVKKLQSQQNTTFVKCYEEITADPDPLAVYTKIPTVEMYLSTMNFMALKIATILQKTKDALEGKPQKEEGGGGEGFVGSQSCGCLSPEAAAAIQATVTKNAEEGQQLKKAIQQILASIKPIVKDKASLEGQLSIINKGIDELMEYKRKAESGELVHDVHISE
jgi:hypothetical protein